MTNHLFVSIFLLIHYVLVLIFCTSIFLFSSSLISQETFEQDQLSDHEKAIKAVNEGEILPLDEILFKLQKKFAGTVISINLKDNEKGLFGWVYDIMIIEPDNNVKQLRVDAGTSTILSIKSGED